MRKLIAIAIAAGILSTAQAQITPQMFVPTPFGVVMTVGKWLLANNNTKQVYYIEVRGQGPTAEEARMNGFRLAVEQALGSVIASETEQRNSRIQRDEVISYAGGFVERFEIVNSMNTGSGYEIAMKVWVSRNNLAERLLVKSKADGQVDGARASIAVDTTQYSRSQGDRLLTTVLRDFPERSFDVKLESTRVEIDSSRNTQLVVPYMITWNKQYLKSLMEAWGKVETCNRGTCTRDRQTTGLLVDELILSRPLILVTVSSPSGQVQFRSCYEHDALTQGNPSNYGYFVHRETTEVNHFHKLVSLISIPVSKQNLADMSQVEVRVVRQANCPTQVLAQHK
jgi:hypothetical protein